MKKVILALVVCAAVSQGQNVGNLSIPATPAPSYLINQNFEDAGYDNGESWIEGGTWDEDFMPGLAGNQSCHHADGGSLVSPEFVAQSHVWIYLQIQFTSVVDNAEILSLRSAAGADLAVLKARPKRLFRIECGSVPSADTGDAFPIATKLHVWVHYIKGTGSNGFASVGFSTDGTRPDGGRKYRQVTTGNATADGVRLRFNGEVGNSFIIDRILVSASGIGDNP